MVLKQPESYLGKQQKQRGTLSPGKRCKTVQQCFSPDIQIERMAEGVCVLERSTQSLTLQQHSSDV